MLTELKDSIKAKLYDFAYTPFMSSFVISWVVINHKYLLIYFSQFDLGKKLLLLEKYSYREDYWFNCFIYPFLFGLFYVFIYPYAAKVFYDFTLKRTVELKKLKQKIDDETPITQDEARQIRLELFSSAIESDELRKKLAEVEKSYQKAERELRSKDAPYNLNNLARKFPLDQETKETQSLPQEEDRTKFLRYLYNSNYESETESNLLSRVVGKVGFARPKAKKILDELIEEGILSFMGPNKYVIITKQGNEKLLELFDNDVSVF